VDIGVRNVDAFGDSMLVVLGYLVDIGVRNVDAFDDSMLVVQQMKGESQCLDGVLNSYRDRCLDIIKTLDTFGIYHIPRDKNQEANALAQHASGYEVTNGLFVIKEGQTMQCMFISQNKLIKGSEANMAAPERPTMQNSKSPESAGGSDVSDGRQEEQVGKGIELESDHSRDEQQRLTIATRAKGNESAIIEDSDWRSPLIVYQRPRGH
jgi:hypothetical protein